MKNQASSIIFFLFSAIALACCTGRFDSDNQANSINSSLPDAFQAKFGRLPTPQESESLNSLKVLPAEKITKAIEEGTANNKKCLLATETRWIFWQNQWTCSDSNPDMQFSVARAGKIDQDFEVSNGSPSFKSRDNIMFYMMDYLHGVNQAQAGHNGPPGDQKNGWWKLNPNFMNPNPVNCGVVTGNPALCDIPGTPPITTARFRSENSLLGLYSSADPAVIKQHAYWMRSIGMTAIVVDWTNHGDPNLEAVYMTAHYQALKNLLETYASIREFTPPKVMVTMRDFCPDVVGCDAISAQVSASVAELYKAYPQVLYYFNDGGSDSSKPMLYIFTSPSKLAGSPSAFLRPSCPDCRFHLRWGNGFLNSISLLEPFSQHPQANANITLVKNNLPIWGFIEQQDDRYNTPVAYTANAIPGNPSAQPEFATLHVSTLLGLPYFPQPPGLRPDFAGRFDPFPDGSYYIDKSAEAMLAYPPQISLFHAFNYQIAWYFIPMEGLNVNFTGAIEPAYPLPPWQNFIPAQKDIGPFPAEMLELAPRLTDAQESSFFMMDKAAQISFGLRALKKTAPGKPEILSCSFGRLVFHSIGFPTRYRIAIGSEKNGRWKVVDANQLTSIGERAGLAIPLDTENIKNRAVYVQTKNAFGESSVTTTKCTP